MALPRSMRRRQGRRYEWIGARADALEENPFQPRMAAGWPLDPWVSSGPAYLLVTETLVMVARPWLVLILREVDRFVCAVEPRPPYSCALSERCACFGKSPTSSFVSR